MNDDVYENVTHGHEFYLFKFYWLNYSKELHVFQVHSWDNGDPYGASLFGMTLTPKYFELSIFFMNFMFVKKGIE